MNWERMRKSSHSTLSPENWGEGHKPKIIYMKRHHLKLHYIVLCLSSHQILTQTIHCFIILLLFPWLGRKARIHHNSIFLLFAAVLAANTVNSFHRYLSSKKSTPISLPPKHVIWTKTERRQGTPGRSGRRRICVKRWLFLLSYQVSGVHIQEVSFLTLAAP